MGRALTFNDSPAWPEGVSGFGGGPSDRDQIAVGRPTVVLGLQSLTKEFAGIRVLDAVDLDLCRGEIHALVGENGSGKSTLVKIVAGVYRQDGGAVFVDGRRIAAGNAADGTAFIHQDLGLVGTMTVAENVALLTGYPRRRGLISWRRLSRRAAEILRAVGLDVDPALPLHLLSAAEQSLVAIARALAVAPKVLVLDEPTATLPEHDVATLFDALSRLKQQGLAILYVSHRLDEVFRIADIVTVLRDGKRVLTRPISTLTSADLIQGITGQLPREIPEMARASGRKAILSVVDLEVGTGGPMSFHVAEGEVFALVGLRGAGHESIGRAIFGDVAVGGGVMTLDGERVSFHTVGAAIRHGVGLVPGDRHAEGVALGMSVGENLVLNPHTSGTGSRWIGTRTERARWMSILARYDVRPRDGSRLIDHLSGGNQQKVVLARWMAIVSRLLILEDPTTGVDVGAKVEIYTLVAELLQKGCSVLLISTDFEEVTRIAHRALIVRSGRPTAELTREQLSISALTAAATGMTATSGAV